MFWDLVDKFAPFMMLAMYAWIIWKSVQVVRGIQDWRYDD